MTDDLIAAALALGIEQGQIVTHRYEDDVLILLVDRGIKGTTKHYLKVAQLPKPEPVEEPAVEPEPESPGVLDAMTVSELRELAKEQGVSYSGLRKDELIAALTDEEE